uniref:ATP synthase complex subunit 8 n=1 Tax=Leiocephalus personatus TaxID=211984 RepID=C4T8C6_9SAUR|nr:ATP synthase F0 subunit 8 [Leiocephalus personatus]BAH70438.1 ATPase subunit 8 [Leiocephalus personatus]
MPQLNPSPWFLIALLTWGFLLFIFLTKTLNMKPLNNPTTKNNKHLTPSWNWPWL